MRSFPSQWSLCEYETRCPRCWRILGSEGPVETATQSARFVLPAWQCLVQVLFSGSHQRLLDTEFQCFIQEFRPAHTGSTVCPAHCAQHSGRHNLPIWSPLWILQSQSDCQFQSFKAGTLDQTCIQVADFEFANQQYSVPWPFPANIAFLTFRHCWQFPVAALLACLSLFRELRPHFLVSVLLVLFKFSNSHLTHTQV